MTVDAILEAAARLFAELGRAGATTNHIARAAGVSIGSLYEYFPNKDAILVALVEREIEAMIGHIRAELELAAAAPGESLGGLLERFVGAMLDVHERDPDLYRVVFAEAPHPGELHACVLRMEGELAHTLEELLRERADVASDDFDMAAHLVVQTAEALTHRFVHHGLHDLDREAFLREVVRLLSAYLRGDEGDAGIR